jgi:hypothetical protein
MQSKKEYLLQGLLAGSALVLVNQDGMLMALTFDNLYSLVSIEGNDITFIMRNFKKDEDGDLTVGDKEISWTFNTEDIYLLKTFDTQIENTIQTSFWLDKYPHNDVLKGVTNIHSFINDTMLASEDLQNKLPPVIVDKLVETVELLVNPENENEVFDCDTEEDSDIFFMLEEYLLNTKGYLALTDMYVPIALS